MCIKLYIPLYFMEFICVRMKTILLKKNYKSISEYTLIVNKTLVLRHSTQITLIKDASATHVKVL